MPKTVALRGIDVSSDLAEINAGRAVLNEAGDIVVSSGRTYGRHTESGNVFLRSGSPGTVDVTQAEFRVLRLMVQNGGLQGPAASLLDGLLEAGNAGVSGDSVARLLRLYGQ